MPRILQATFVTALLPILSAMAQNTISLNDFISIAQSLGSELDPQSTHSSVRSTASSAKTSGHSSSTAQSTSRSSTAASATGAAASQSAAAASSGGLDPHTRTIVIALSVVFGLLLLGMLVGCLLCCLHRRRRHHARGEQLDPKPSDKRRGASRFFAFPRRHKQHRQEQMREVPTGGIATNDDWEKGGNHHHGFAPAAVASAGMASHNHNRSDGSINGPSAEKYGAANEHPPLPRPRTNEHPAFRNHSGVENSGPANHFAASTSPVRKPVPTNRHNHHDGMLVAGAATLGGGAAYKHHQHDKNATNEPYGRDVEHDAVTPAFGASNISENGKHSARGELPPQYAQAPEDSTNNGFSDPKRRSYEPGFDDSRYSYDSHRHGSGVPLAAGAAAVAGAGAIAQHEHHRSSGDQGRAPGEQARGSYDNDRPPTPFGLGAFDRTDANQQPDRRPGPLSHTRSVEPTVVNSTRFSNDNLHLYNQGPNSYPDHTAAAHNHSGPYPYTAVVPTTSQQRALQERDLLATGNERRGPSISPPTGSNSGRSSYGETSSSSSGNSRHSGSRVPAAALGAIGRGSPRVSTQVEPTSPLVQELSRDDDEAVSERTPLSGPTSANPTQTAARPALLSKHPRAGNDPSYSSNTDSSESSASWRSARDSEQYARSGMVSRDPSYGLPTPSQPWTGNMPGGFPGERPAVPAYQVAGAGRSGEHQRGSYSPVRQSGEYVRPGRTSGSQSPALQPPGSHTPRQSTEYDPFSYDRPVIGSGRRSYGNSSPARFGGNVVRFSDRNDEWRYDDGDDYSDRGGGGGNVYDGYKYGTHSGRGYDSDDEGVGRAV